MEHVQTSTDEEVRYLGKHPQNQMVIIPPDRTEISILNQLEKLDKFLQKPSSRANIDRRIDIHGDPSVCRIQGGRYEIFVESHGQSSHVFDCLARKVGFCKEELKDYLRRQLQRDNRLLLNHRDISRDLENAEKPFLAFELGHLSLLINFEPVAAQLPHIDIIEPNYQCCLFFTDNSPGTLIGQTTVNNSLQKICNVQDLANFWAQNGSQMPEGIKKELENNEHSKDLLMKFGNVLLSPTEFLSPGTQISQGTVLTLPGSTVHAGPCTYGYRCVLFASLRPKKVKFPIYDPSTQLNGVTCCMQLLQFIWLRIEVTERIYLLERTVEILYLTRARDVSQHIKIDSLASFLQSIESGNAKPNEIKQKMLSLARNDSLFQITSGVLQRFKSVENHSLFANLECVSLKKNLMAKYDDAWFDVVVYRRPNSNFVMLFYPVDQSWEGNHPDDKYTLTMNCPGKIFNGSNGIVTATDKTRILFKCKDLSRKKRKCE